MSLSESEMNVMRSPDAISEALPGIKAECLMHESLSADMDAWIVYDPDENTESIDEWLEENKPSMTKRSDGIGWIAVNASSAFWHKNSVEVDEDITGLQDSWELFQQSGRPISSQAVVDLAKAHHVTAGKWLFHVHTGMSVDHHWSLVAKAVVSNKLRSSAKVSPYQDVEQSSPSGEVYGYKHVVCVYNDDFTDEKDVFDLESGLRGLGLKCQLQYKPDVHTYLGIYRGNKWGLRPSLYESIYDLAAGCSKITTH